MSALARQLLRWYRATFETRLPEPEPVYAPKSREMTGFFSSLTPDQQAKALAYRGAENHGDPAFPKAKAA
jgi:hypothetical protein